MLVAEDLMLLATLSDKGRPPLAWAQNVEPAVAGALVAELTILGRVDIVGARLVVTDATAVGDELLDQALELLNGDAIAKARNLKQQVRRLDAGLGRLNHRVTSRLVSAGVLGEQGRRLALVTVVRRPVVDRARRQQLVGTVRSAVQSGGGNLEPRTASLIALLGAAKLLGCVTESRAESRQAKAVARTTLASSPVGQAVAAIVADLEAVAAAGAVVAAAGG